MLKEKDELIERVINEMSMMMIMGPGMPDQKFFNDGFWKIREELHRIEEEGERMDSDRALVALGDSYRHGTNGMEQDDNKAVVCYERGAAVDNILCTQQLGVCFFEGRGVEQDYDNAYMCLSRDCDCSPEVARCRALCLLNGWGTKQDLKEAAWYFQYAAKEGDAQAAYHLGVCYEEGKGVEASREEAAKWYGRAAEQGLTEAADRLRELQK